MKQISKNNQPGLFDLVVKLDSRPKIQEQYICLGYINRCVAICIGIAEWNSFKEEVINKEHWSSNKLKTVRDAANFQAKNKE